MDFVGLVTVGDLAAKPLDLCGVGHVGDMGGEAQALRQPRRFAQTPGFRDPRRREIAHRDVAALGGELAHQLASHAGAAAGDGRDPAGKILHLSASSGLLVPEQKLPAPVFR